METKVKIISIFDKHEDFIKLQYDSIIKHVKGNYTYIVFNNASNEDQAIKNQNACNELGITCVRISVNYSQGPSNIAGDALNAAFGLVPNELVFKIDSDMFFISDINLNEIFLGHDLLYIPNYHPNSESMWSGVFGVNLKKVDFVIDFRPGVVPFTDTFGTSCYLTSNPKFVKQLFTLYNLHNYNDGVMETMTNNDCRFNIKDGEIIFYERPELNHSQELLNKLPTKLNDIMLELDKYDFPKPYHIDIIEMNGIDFIFHFKSSNWCPWYYEEYVSKKTEALTKYLNSKI